MQQIILMVPETESERRNHDVCHNFVTMDGRLTDDGNALVEVAFEVLSRACFVNAEKHGWYEESQTERNFGEVIALIHSEVSEALEEYRNGDVPQQISYHYGGDKISRHSALAENFESPNWVLGKPIGVASEFADIIIRILDYAGAYGVPVGKALVHKHEYNYYRPHRHGDKKM